MLNPHFITSSCVIDMYKVNNIFKRSKDCNVKFLLIIYYILLHFLRFDVNYLQLNFLIKRVVQKNYISFTSIRNYSHTFWHEVNYCE